MNFSPHPRHGKLRPNGFTHFNPPQLYLQLHWCARIPTSLANIKGYHTNVMLKIYHALHQYQGSMLVDIPSACDNYMSVHQSLNKLITTWIERHSEQHQQSWPKGLYGSPTWVFWIKYVRTVSTKLASMTIIMEIN